MLVAAALLVAAPLWWGSSAQADSSGTVSFTGGCTLELLGPLGSVAPSPEQVTVDAGDEVRFANQLGKPATLSFDGEAAAQLPRGGSVGVVFYEGPVTATMEISCLLGDLSGTATVAVHLPEPEPSDPSPTTPSPSPGDDPPRSDSGSGSGPGQGGPPPAATDGTNPWAGTPSAGASESPQSLHEDADTLPEDLALPRWDVRSEPDKSSETTPDGDTVGQDGSDQDQAQDPDQEAGELAQTAGTGSGGGPNGMLALIATVCLAGVTAGAIRAIVAQRSARTEWA